MITQFDPDKTTWTAADVTADITVMSAWMMVCASYGSSVDPLLIFEFVFDRAQVDVVEVWKTGSLNFI